MLAKIISTVLAAVVVASFGEALAATDIDSFNGAFTWPCDGTTHTFSFDESQIGQINITKSQLDYSFGASPAIMDWIVVSRQRGSSNYLNFAMYDIRHDVNDWPSPGVSVMPGDSILIAGSCHQTSNTPATVNGRIQLWYME